MSDTSQVKSSQMYLATTLYLQQERPYDIFISETTNCYLHILLNILVFFLCDDLNDNNDIVLYIFISYFSGTY